jgi:membrane protease YdiL (CAAX protease family)
MQYISLTLLILYLLLSILFTFGLKVHKIYFGIGFLFGVVSLYLHGMTVISQEAHPLFYLPAGITVGIVIFFISLFLTTFSFKEVLLHGLPLKGIAALCRSRLRWAAAMIYVCAAEEFIWRAVIQDYFGRIYLESPHLSIILTAVMFTIIHKKSIQDDILKQAEFLLFSLFLGYAYFVTHSLIFVFLIHLVRNLSIEYRNTKKEKEGRPDDGEIPCLDSPPPVRNN